MKGDLVASLRHCLIVSHCCVFGSYYPMVVWLAFSVSLVLSLRPLMGEFCLVVNVKSNMVDESCGVVMLLAY